MKVEGESITLRDWFAGQLIAGKLENVSWYDEERTKKEAERLAHWAYTLSDAMIRERTRGAK